MSLLVRDLRCQQAVELVTEYLEGALSRRDRRRLERHLAGCPHCHEYFEQVRAVMHATGEVGPESLDSATLEGLLRLFRDYRADR